MGREDGVKFILDKLADISPDASKYFEYGSLRDWTLDEDVGGTHLNYAPGQMREFFPAITEPEGRLYFAGEHTSLWTGWMNGPLATGRRAVNQILSSEQARPNGQ